MTPTTLVQLRTIDLDPLPDATGIDCQSAFCRHLCHMHERDWVPQVPSHAPHDNVAGIVAPLERIRGSDGQHSPYQLFLPDFAMEPALNRHLQQQCEKRRERKLRGHEETIAARFER